MLVGCQKYGSSADEWAASICSKLEAASHNAPRGKHARHADIVQLVHVTAPSLGSALNSLQSLTVTDERRDSDTAVVGNTQSVVSRDSR